MIDLLNTEYLFITLFTFLQRGWAKSFRPETELFVVILIVVIFVIWGLTHPSWKYQEKRRIGKSLESAKQYMYLNKWSIEYDFEIPNLKYPQVFLKKHDKGTLIVFQENDKTGLSISFSYSDKIIKNYKVRINKETTMNMETIFSFDDKTNVLEPAGAEKS